MSATATRDPAAPAMTKTVMVQGVQVYVVERGTGIPTLFLHGVPDSAEMWNGLMAELEGDYRCIAIDLPGLGRSVAPADFDLSLENKARFIDELLKTLGISGPLNLVVHDFGGHYGLAWAVRHPAKVRRIVISNTAFFSTYRWHRNAQFWRTPILGELSMAMSTPSLYLRVMRPVLPTQTEAQLRTIYDLTMAKPAARKMILRLYRTANPETFAGWDDSLRALTARVPTCVIWGDQDPFAASSYAEQFGAGTVRHIADYGHWVLMEAPGQAAAILRPFLA